MNSRIQYRLLALTLVSLSLVSCEPEEVVVGGGVNPWRLFVSTDDSQSQIAVAELPSNSILPDGGDLLNTGGKVTHMVNFRDFLYVFTPEQHRIDVLSLKVGDDFKFVETLDFSSIEPMLEPSDISFGNATTGYITFSNSSTVIVLDVTTIGGDASLCRLCDELEAGQNPVAITVLENRMFVANQGDNSVTVINTPTGLTSTISGLPAAPTFIEAIPGRDQIAVLSLGAGKLEGDNREQSESILTFINAGDESIVESIPIFLTESTRLSNTPRGLVITERDYIMIPSNHYVLRLDLRNLASSPTRVLNLAVKSSVYNSIRDEVIFIDEDNRTIRVHSATGSRIASYALPASPIATLVPR